MDWKDCDLQNADVMDLAVGADGVYIVGGFAWNVNLDFDLADPTAR